VNVLLVAAGGGLGALARYLLDHGVRSAFPASRFPLGTLLVNLWGSFVLGWLSGRYAGDPDAMLLIGTGFCGAFTTFSTFSYETVLLVRQREYSWAFCNVAITVAGCCSGAAVALG
jgi:fluoride exporter